VQLPSSRQRRNSSTYILVNSAGVPASAQRSWDDVSHKLQQFLDNHGARLRMIS